MSQILAELAHSLKSANSLIELESRFTITMAQIACTFAQQLLEEKDQALYNEAKAAGAKCLAIKERCVNCLFGPVRFRRRYVQYADGKRAYPLDNHLGLVKNARFSALLIARVGELASGATYRITAQAISSLTPVSISHQAIPSLIRQAGEAIGAVREAETVSEVDPSERKRVDRLYIEGDAFQVKLKAGRRIDTFRYQVSEGVSHNGSRHTLINRHVVTNFNRAIACDEMVAYIAQHYDLRDTLVLTGSDNGSGFSPETFDEFVLGCQASNRVHILDRYHLTRKIKELLGQHGKLAGKLNQVLFPRYSDMMVDESVTMRCARHEAQWNRVMAILDTAESLVMNFDGELDREQLDGIERLRAYLKRNWTNITPFSDRNWASILRPLGSCESNHRRYTYRLKKNGRSWTKRSLAAMLRILDARQNGDYEQSLYCAGILDTTLPEAQTTPQPPVGFRVSEVFKSSRSEHIGAHNGRIASNAPTSSAMGQLAKHLSGF